MIPTRTMKGSCEISTAALTLTSQPPAFQGEAGALQVQISFTLGGSAFSPDASTEAQVYLYYPASDVMTTAQTMVISGNTATATLSAEDQATPGAPYLVVQLTDTSSGALIVSCMAPLIIWQTRADTLTNGTAPNPSEVVYVGRAPYLSATNTWVVWDNTSASFVDSGISAIGPKGDPGAVQTVNGNEPDEQGNAQVDGLIYETTAQALEAMSQQQQAALYQQGYRAIVATYGETATMHALAEDGGLAWIGCNQDTTNLTDNSDFKNPVNQRGQDSYSGSFIYSVDRWVVSGTASVQADGISVTQGGFFLQRMEPLTDGESYTLSARFGGQLLTGTITYDSSTESAQIAVSNDLGTLYVQNIGGGLCQFVINPVAQSIISAPSLYRGSYTAKTLPPWIAPDYSAELAECQRYYFAFCSNDYESEWVPVELGFGDTFFRFKTGISQFSMRSINPSIVGDVQLYAPDTEWTNVEAFCLPSAGGFIIRMVIPETLVNAGKNVAIMRGLKALSADL